MSSIPLDYFLNDEELLKRHELAIPTDEMYRFFPPKEDIYLSDSDPQKNYRYIFNGQPKTDYEQRKLNEFQQYELTKGKLNYPNEWLESETMRLLQAAEFDIEKTYKLIVDGINFINSIPKSINNNIVSLLNSGIIYLYGRDHYFRPIIIVSFNQYKNIIEKNIYQEQDITNSMIYLINYVLKYMMIPGQIENWICLIDFKGAGVSDVSDFKKLTKILNSYRGRVFRNFFINLSGLLKIAVKAAVNLFGKHSARKLKILDKDELNKMQEFISPNNIQKKYGGTAPDVVPNSNNLFPPKMPSTNYELPGERLNIISEKAYKEMCLNSNPYKPFTISPKYLEKWNKEKEEKEMEEKKEKEQEILKEQIPTKKIEQIPILENKIAEEKKIEEIKMNEYHKREDSREYVINFLNDFEEFNIEDTFEEKKYYSKPGVNINNINSFFQKISNYRKM